MIEQISVDFDPCVVHVTATQRMVLWEDWKSALRIGEPFAAWLMRVHGVRRWEPYTVTHEMGTDADGNEISHVYTYYKATFSEPNTALLFKLAAV